MALACIFTISLHHSAPAGRDGHTPLDAIRCFGLESVIGTAKGVAKARHFRRKSEDGGQSAADGLAFRAFGV